MTRLSKQAERRAVSPRKHKRPSVKTGPLKDKLPKGYKEQFNALDKKVVENKFIPKI